ncbi:MAG: spore coat associated protein CotJA [Clostridia bacterium]|nr:spore coat associated protein CotJA [Clostridia bacterium]
MDILECNAVSPLPKDPTVTMAYVPFQTKSKLYSSEKALSKGTLFEVLDKPFLGGSSRI